MRNHTPKWTAAEQQQFVTGLQTLVRHAGAPTKRGGSRRWTRTQPGSQQSRVADHRAVQPRRGGVNLTDGGCQTTGGHADRRMRIRAAQRARRMPWKAAAGTAAAGYLAWAVAALVEATDAAPRILVALVAAATAATIGCAVVWAKRTSIDARWRNRTWTANAVATLWVLAAAAAGVGWVLLSTLPIATVVLGAGWWRAHRVYPPARTDLVLVAGTAVVAPDTLKEVSLQWARKVAIPNGPVPKSQLTDGKTLERALRFMIETDPGSIEFGELLNRRGKVAAALRRRTVDIQLDPHPTRADLAVLTIITENILENGVPYPGPRYHDGRIPIGPFSDGQGEAEVVVTDSAGCYGGAASGEPRSGKSSCFEAIGLSLCASGEWIVVYCDGDPTGGSSPLMNDHMHWPKAGPEGALVQLAAMEAWLELRGIQKNTLTEGPDGKPIPLVDQTTQRPARKILPCPAYPGIMWMIDELHRLTGDDGLKKERFVERLERIVRIGPKYGLAVFTASHSLLMGDFGNSTTLRAFLTARNLIAFRNQNKTEVAVINGLNIPPYALPAGGGYAYTTAGGRLAMLRAAWSHNMAEFAAQLPEVDLDEDGQLAVADLWSGERPDPEQMVREAQSQLAEWRSSRRAGITSPRGALPAAASAAAGSPLAGATATITRLHAAMPAALTGADIVTARPAGRDRELSEEARGVLAVIEDGHFLDVDSLTKRADILASTGWDKNKVARALNELKAAGLVTQPKQGFYRLIGEPAEQSA